MPLDPSIRPTDWYPQLLRVVQPWICRYPLIESQGNFGSIDGNPPCGMQFNEIRLHDWGALLLEGDVSSGGDEAFSSVFPQLLCNGAWAHSGEFEHELHPEVEGPASVDPEVVVPTGRMKGGKVESFFPPHNLLEACAALEFLLDHPDAAPSELLRILKGPDFPTGGTILNDTSLEQIYASGKGELIVAGRATVERLSGGRSLLTIREMPYGINKTDLISRIAHRIREGWLEGVEDVRDVSDRDDVRVEIEIKQGVDPHSIERQFHETGLVQNRLVVKMVVLEEDTPRQVSLFEMMKGHLERNRATLGERSLRELLRRMGAKSDSRRTKIGE